MRRTHLLRAALQLGDARLLLLEVAIHDLDLRLKLADLLRKFRLLSLQQLNFAALC